MPLTELHKRKCAKNWLVFAVLIALAGMFYWLTMIKIGELQ